MVFGTVFGDCVRGSAEIWGRGPARGPRRTESDLGYVDRLRALVAALLFIGDLGVLLEALEARSVDPGVVDEQVSIAFIGCDESVALLVVEPLDGTGCHGCSTFLYCGPARSYDTKSRTTASIRF